MLFRGISGGNHLGKRRLGKCCTYVVSAIRGVVKFYIAGVVTHDRLQIFMALLCRGSEPLFFVQSEFLCVLHNVILFVILKDILILVSLSC
jgi:hypothetical protein